MLTSLSMFDIIRWFLLPVSSSVSSFGVVFFDMEGFTKVLYNLANFWGNDEIFVKLIYVICNTFYSI